MRGIISHCGSKLSLLVKASQFSVSLGCCQSYRPFSVQGWGAFSSFPSQHSPCTSQPILYHLSFHRVTALIKPCTQGPPQHLFFHSFFLLFRMLHGSWAATGQNCYVPTTQLTYHSHIYKHCANTTNHTTRLALFVTQSKLYDLHIHH